MFMPVPPLCLKAHNKFGLTGFMIGEQFA
jgi:hypothetical protein